MGRYFIIVFYNDRAKNDILSSPNGTYFYYGPIHMNSIGNVGVFWSDHDDADKSVDQTDLKVIPTDETCRLSVTTIAKGLGVDSSDISRTNKQINKFLENIFKRYAPHLDFS